ncbi:uncharacterized protein LOC127290821 [Leptopilina boulardi]|uniref:uncharacterized protein LOC127290821 n=1 Tax=Leptopilina boulardi TaxID=63433 RepID=UPI0021F63195|nr:uncharacterized protein LOC127290821 [Leptopilina boulardi]
MIDEDKTLPGVVKLQYLKQCLIDEAADFVKDVKVEESNYKPTWEALKGRYCNVRLLIHTHFNTLYNLPKLQDESVSDLKTLIDKTRQAVRSLRNIGRDIVGDWLVYHTSERLDPASRLQWENYLSTRSSKLPNSEGNDSEPDHYPTFEALAKFIDERIITLNMTDSHRSMTTPNSPASSLHQIKDCTSKGRCFECHKQHHTLLHRPPREETSENEKNAKHPHQTQSPSATTAPTVHTNTTSISSSNRTILLATACAILEGPKGQTTARAMLDQGSEVSFISQDIVRKLRLPCYPANVTILGLENHKVGEAKTVATMTLRSVHAPDFHLEFQAYVVPKLTSRLPTRKIVEINLDWLGAEKLADPLYYQPGTIQLIIGADYYRQLLLPGLYQIESPKATAQKTALGWVISGTVETEFARRAEPTTSRTVSSMHCASSENIQDELQRFWEFEAIPNNKVIKPDDESCENHFANTHTRTPEGQYMVRLPIKCQPPEAAAETRRLAASSLIGTERRFKQDIKLSEAYCEFMDKYESDGHMKRVPEEELNNPKAWYIPHHAVVQQTNNLDWKLRVVFNASRLTSQKKCLNDFLHAGPALQNDIGLILLNWRRHKVVFTADIVKMFRQILVHPEDRDLQRILWRSTPEKPIEEYRLCTVTYGTACAPYLAIRTLQQLSIDEGAQFPLGADSLLDNTYVDDIFDGDDDVLHAEKKRDQVIDLCAKGNLKLDKWAVNHPDLHPSSCAPPSSEIIDKITVFKTLGILWDSRVDYFAFNNPQKTHISEDATKRIISSTIAKLYDPLGWLAPITVVAKIMLQDIWILRIDWDVELPTEVQEHWTQYYQSLAGLSGIQIPRWLGSFSNSLIELHGFSDASTPAYAAAVYVRVLKYKEDAQVTLLAAKSKVAPIKTATIPKLELCGAALLTELPSVKWRHVPSQENPADLATRGLQPETLQENNLWWHGPQWLSLSPVNWPSQSQGHDTNSEEVQAFLTVEAEVNNEILSRFSSLQRLIRVVAFCLRVFQNFRAKGSGNSFKDTALSLTEIESARSTVLAIAQRKTFSEEIDSLKNGRNIPKHSKLRNLNPFLDKAGILRVGGRLKHSSLVFSSKHPPILPKDSPLTPLYVNLAHKVSCHGGPKLTLSILRNLVWIVGAASLVRKLVRTCVPCHRIKPRFPTQLMGDLPPARIEPARPFTNCGLDYAGPFQLRATKGRGFKSYKGYIVVFVCFATKAIHLEAVSDMTTSTFLAAYRRFTGRRGLCRRLYSDNGTTFQRG